MLQFFSSSTNIVNSKRAITECLENALQGESDLHCDLLIIYSSIGHNFRELLAEAKRLCPMARIAGCTGAGVISKKGPDESMKALAIMAIKGPDSEFEITSRDNSGNVNDPFLYCAEMAEELKNKNPHINMIHFLPSGFMIPADLGIEGIKSVFGKKIPVFGALSMDNQKGVICYCFHDERVIEKGTIMIGFADPTLRFINRVNHGFNIIEDVTFKVTKSIPGCILELDGRQAWKVITESLGMPITVKSVEVTPVAGLARELPQDCWEEYESKYILFVTMLKNEENNSFFTSVTCEEGTILRLTKRDEKLMFNGVKSMVQKILNHLNGKRPVAVFHTDCVLRGRFSLNQILKEELINQLHTPLSPNKEIPWLGIYAAGEIGMLGGEARLHQMSSSLFVIYR